MKATYQQCAEVIASSEVMFIHSGAGIGVDSGLPDYRGNKGFWNCYPMYEKLGIDFVDAANPYQFEKDPSFAWGFYGHRTNLYRETQPHRGFHLMQQWIEKYNQEYFIVTSNVDGHFQKAGFSDDKIYEIHGSINHLQCLTPCRDDIWENNADFEIDFATMTNKQNPSCPHCGGTSRPNILMFGDWSWISRRSSAQQKRLFDFDAVCCDKKTVVIEIGAGTAIPSIRSASWRRGSSGKATVIRINPREPQISAPHISVACGGLEALEGIDDALQKM
ncbi:SIR2 family NAD-dependent protein deacylase [Candidatus Uabimicrobium amorphum]|uniref:protein acetyllysine N-acetyltransferase n=1 Tax=Uabimicrobium amorphum TaxID=2596890 RepID=A0A5S9IKC6_UABAM|nr:Sir2 family NAD-dependent protein deacetylase [Candidatus Uabimicrobium amorphum]BBM82185.1 NAD-dependent protein deacetylase [Candidatus Uabimicrobium amorphum]